MDDKQLQRMINGNWTLRQYNLTRLKVSAYAGFAVGDFVIEKNSGGRYTENIGGSGLKARFKIVCRDTDSQLTFAQRINMDGKLGKIFCLEGRVDSTFELDSNYLTAQLVADNYDPNQELKEAKERVYAIKKANAKLFKSLGDPLELKKVIENKMVAGFKFWTCCNNSTTAISEHTVVSVFKMKTGQSPRHWYGKNNAFEEVCKCNFEIKVSSGSSSHTSTMYADDLFDHYKISETAPHSLKVTE